MRVLFEMSLYAEGPEPEDQRRTPEVATQALFDAVDAAAEILASHGFEVDGRGYGVTPVLAPASERQRRDA